MLLWTVVAPLAGGSTAAAAPAPPVAAPELPVCPAPVPLEHRTAPIGTDANVSVFVGGDYEVGGGAAESEGVQAVGGTATFDKAEGGVFNIGVVGFGSGVVPPPGSDMLRSGGDSLVIDRTTVDVGSGIGGNVVAGGAARPTTRFETSGGTITSGASHPLGPFSDFGRTITTKSAEYAALSPTGTPSEQYGTVTFTGDGSSPTQVFSVSGAALGSAASPRSIAFARIPAGARIIVNVQGAVAQVFPAGFFTDASSDQIDFSDPRFVGLATHTMWNFPSADTVTIGTGDQLLGSVMVPRPDADTRITASTNGRLLLGGNLAFLGAGNEAHSFPFPDDDFVCKPSVDPPVQSGALAVRKVVVDPDGVVDPGRDYVGTWSCSVGSGATIPGGSWRVAADGVPHVIAANLPVGATCTITEARPATPDPDDPSYAWEPVTITPATVTIGADTTSAVTVTNTIRRDSGTFRIRKTLDDPDGVVDPGRTFTGSWTCAVNGTAVAEGVWTLTAGGAPQTLGPAPIGATCTVAEDTPAPPAVGDPGAVWGPVTIGSDTVVIASGEPPVVTVRNSVERISGSFAIMKSVLGAGAGLPGGSSFSFAWTCTAPDGTVTGPNDVSLRSGSVVPVEDVPPGSECTVTEGPQPPLSDESYRWERPSFSVGEGPETAGDTASFTIPSGAGPVVRVGFTDTIEQRFGYFAIRKVLDDPDQVTAGDATYHGVWSCDLPDEREQDGTFDVRGDGAAQLLARVPFGSRCLAVEDLGVTPVPASDGDRAYGWGQPLLDAGEVVIGDDGETVGVIRVTNVVDAVTTGATIAKTITDPDGAVPDGTRFTGTVRCVAPDGTVSTQRWSIVAGAAAAPLTDGLLEGTECTVQEDTAAPPDADHTWLPPVVSPTSFVAHVGTAAGVTVSNVLPEEGDPSGPPVPPTDPPVQPVTPPVAPTVPPATTAPSADGGLGGPSGGLAWTGAELTVAAVLGLLMVTAGVAIAARPARRRRRHRH